METRLVIKRCLRIQKEKQVPTLPTRVYYIFSGRLMIGHLFWSAICFTQMIILITVKYCEFHELQHNKGAVYREGGRS